MKKRIYLLSTLLPVLGFLFAPPALSAEADLVKAEKVYKRSCATCHGKQGEKPAMGESKIIAIYINGDKLNFIWISFGQFFEFF